MKSAGTDPTYLDLVGKDSGVKMLFGAEILKEYYWPIVTVYSSTQFAVSGDATSIFSPGDTIQLSSRKYSDVHVIDTVMYSLVSPVTNFILSSGTVSAEDLNATISKVYHVSERILQDSLGDVFEAIEGTTLNAFQASSFNFKLDNSDQELLNEKTDTGILWSGAELLEVTVVTETQIDFTNITLSTNAFKGGVLTVLSGNAKNLKYSIFSNTITTATVIDTSTMSSDGVAVGDSVLISSGVEFNLKFYIGLRQLI